MFIKSPHKVLLVSLREGAYRKQGTGNRARETGHGKQGTGNRARETGKMGKTDSRERLFIQLLFLS